MEKIRYFIKKNWLYFASFILPFLIMCFVYLSQGIYWGSDTSPLLGDGFHQYVVFDTTLRNILHGTDSLFYTFSSGLGQNFYALSSYYLGSFLSPFVYFFDLKSMPDAVYLFTLIKFGLIGLTTCISIKGIFKKIPETLILTLSTSFALMSFSVSQLEIKTWLDVFIVVPLIIFGLHKLMNGQGRVLYFTSLSILFIQNYYFGYMMALFLVLWYLVQLSWDFKARIRSLPDFAIVSILAGLTSLIMILPTYLDLSSHGETLTKVEDLFTEKSWYLDIFAKNFVGSFDTTKYGSIPMIYVGLFPFILSVLFFTIKSIKLRVKLAYIFLIGIFIVSFRLQYLDLLWQGMHAPNMFLHRYSWLFSLLIILMAAETLNRLEEVKWRQVFPSFLLISFGFLATLHYRKHYDFLGPENYIFILEFFLAYLLISFAFIRCHVRQSMFTLSLLFFVVFELTLNAYYQVDGIAKEWVFASRSSYSKKMNEIDSLVKYSKKENRDFFRTERLDPQTGNDSMKFNYNGISQFSSVRNTQASSTLDKLGFKSAGTNLNLRYQNNSILMDSLFAVKYNLSETDPQKFGFSAEKTERSMTLYENNYALGLAFLTNDVYKDVKFTNLTLDNQTAFLNQLSGLNHKYYERISIAGDEEETEGKVTASIENNAQLSYASVTYTIEVPAGSQVYVNLSDLDFSNDNQTDVNITVNGITNRYPTHNVFPFLNIGYFKEAQTVSIQFSFPENRTVSFNQPEFFSVDVNKYQQLISKLKEQEVSVTTKSNRVTVDYHADRDSSLFFTIPYDKGWTASVDGKKVPLKRAQNGFMKLDVNRGAGRVTLSFVPRGLKEGTAAFILGIVLFFFYDRIRFKWSKKHRDSSA